MTPEEHRESILAAEARCAAGIAADLGGMSPISSSVTDFIEGRWHRWLERRVNAIERAYYLSQGLDPDEDDE